MTLLTAAALITVLNSGWNTSVIGKPKMVDVSTVPDEDKVPPNFGFPTIYVRVGNIETEHKGVYHTTQVTHIPFRVRCFSKSLADLEDLAKEVSRIIIGQSLTGGWYEQNTTQRNERELVKTWDLFFKQTKWITVGAL
jgi:hypothetical protein